MGKQAVIDAYEGRYTPVVPWVPYVGVHGAFLIGETATNILQNPDLLAKAVVNAAERYKADGIPMVFDLAVEAMSMGIKAKWFDDNPPTVIEHPLADMTLAEAGLKIPGPNDGRWPIIIEAGKKAKAASGRRGPHRSHLRSADPRLAPARRQDLHRHGEEARARDGDHASSRARCAAESARIYAEEIGCDIVALVEPVGSQVRPDTYDKFVIPALPGSPGDHPQGGQDHRLCTSAATRPRSSRT